MSSYIGLAAGVVTLALALWLLPQFDDYYSLKSFTNEALEGFRRTQLWP